MIFERLSVFLLKISKKMIVDSEESILKMLSWIWGTFNFRLYEGVRQKYSRLLERFAEDKRLNFLFENSSFFEWSLNRFSQKTTVSMPMTVFFLQLILPNFPKKVEVFWINVVRIANCCWNKNMVRMGEDVYSKLLLKRVLSIYRLVIIWIYNIKLGITEGTNGRVILKRVDWCTKCKELICS